MSRRSIWQSMRMEARSHGSDVETTPISQNASNNDSELGLLRSGSTVGKEESRDLSVEKNNNPTSAKKSKTHNTHNTHNNNNNNNHDDDDQNDHTPARRLHSLENAAKVPIVTLVDVPNVVTSTGKSVPSEVTTVVASPSTSVEVPVREKKSLMKETSINRDNTGRDSSTMRHDDIYMSLQVELAQEKKKNIDAEQRLLTLEKEVKVLRAENMRLASSMGTNEGVVKSIKKNTPDGFPITDGINTHTSSEQQQQQNNNNNNNTSPLEQMVKELQDELRMMKEYTKELESRLAVKSSALEQRTREVEQKENRIRQLERTIADELIWRTKEEHTHHALEEGSNSSGRVTPRFIQRPTNSNININTTGGNILTSTVGVAAPAVVRVPVEQPRSQIHSQIQSQQQSPQQSPQQIPLPSQQLPPQQQIPLPSQQQQIPLQSHYAQEQQSPAKQQRRPSSVRQSRAPSSARVVVQPKEQLKEKERTHTATPRRGSLNSRRSSTATANFTAVRVRRKESTEPTPNTSTTTVPSRASSATRKKSLSKPTHPTRRTTNNINTRISASPTPYVALFDDPLREDITTRRPVKRPTTTLDTSTASISLLSNHTTTTGAVGGGGTAPLLNLDTRSIASTVRSRPRIHQDSDGITTTTTMRSSTTTVVTRSVKRRESPSLVPPPRADYVEERPSEQPFVSEKFSTTTYRPNRLVRYYKTGESEERSDS